MDQGNRIAGTAVTLLCFASGATDVLSYLTLGHIFTSAMTGVTALLLIALVGQKFPTAIRAAVSLFSYMLGGAMAVLLRSRVEHKIRNPSAMRRLLACEVFMLGSYCFISAVVSHPLLGIARYSLIFLSALAMGIQAVIARDIHESGITTVVLNITLTSIVIGLTQWACRREVDHVPGRNKLQMLVVLAYAIGAAGAAVGLRTHAVDSDILPLAAVLITLVLYQIPQAEYQENDG
jgi:uncharacterized membrane protein YoaK (UPF0700 family)